jgi:hypothetical protein
VQAGFFGPAHQPAQDAASDVADVGGAGAEGGIRQAGKLSSEVLDGVVPGGLGVQAVIDGVLCPAEEGGIGEDEGVGFEDGRLFGARLGRDLAVHAVQIPAHLLACGLEAGALGGWVGAGAPRDDERLFVP